MGGARQGRRLAFVPEVRARPRTPRRAVQRGRAAQAFSAKPSLGSAGELVLVEPPVGEGEQLLVACARLREASGARTGRDGLRQERGEALEERLDRPGV